MAQPLAADEAGLGPGARYPEGEEAGDTDWGSTVMKSFWLPTSQCFPTPQMYHFLPGVARVITSFPVVKASETGGTKHC